MLARKTALAAIMGLMSVPGFCQSATSIYKYDALGRLTDVQTGNGIKSTYVLDSADNRSTVQVQRQFDTSWQATSLYHTTGYAESWGGWAATIANPVNFMTYGPYTGSVPVGNRTATWRLMVDVNSGLTTEVVAGLDVYDATAGGIIAQKWLTRADFANPLSYQVFELPFLVDASRAGHVFEFRTYFTAKAYINVEKIGLY